MSVDLSVKIAGVELKFPTVLSSGPMARDIKTIKRVARQYGVGAITTKTVLKKPIKITRPSMKLYGDSLINAESRHPSADSMVKDLKILVKEISTPIIVNASGPPTTETIDMFKSLEEGGASMMEVHTSCGKLEETAEWIGTLKKSLEIPLIVKLDPNLYPFIQLGKSSIAECAKIVEKSGADAISAIDSVGPCLTIDTRTGKPFLGSKYGFGYLSGPAIKPIALRCAAEIAKVVKIPILGGGGITNGEDAMEMFMVGATCVALHAAALRRGLGVFEKIVKEVEVIMKKEGYESLDDVRGMSLKYLK